MTRPSSSLPSSSAADASAGDASRFWSDDELLTRFEAIDLPHGSFDHYNHIRVTWLLLRRYPLAEALARITEGLMRIARAHGVAHHYHATVTWAYVLLIHDRMQASPAEHFEVFVNNHPELFDRERPLLTRYYHEQTLRSADARHHFVWPDRTEPPPAVPHKS